MTEETKIAEKNEETRIYEVGYLLVPHIAEENLGAEVGKIQEVIATQGGIVISEQFPALRELTYTMEQRIDAKIKKYDEGYFGWIKFELPFANIEEIHASLKKNASVIRSIITKTVREDTMSKKPMVAPKKEVKEGEEKPKISEAELDQTIEELVIK